MRVRLIFFLFALLTATGQSTAQTEVVPGLYEYDVPQLQRVNKALEILRASDVDLNAYDIVLYSVETEENRYIITFATSVNFAEDGPIRGGDIRMLFNNETEKLIAVIVNPLTDP